MSEINPPARERYDDMWWSLLERHDFHAAELWLRRLAGQRVVDLGCGQDTRKFQRLLAAFDALFYIGIDKKFKSEPWEMNGEGIVGDILETIKPWPAESFSFALNGINKDYIDPESSYGMELADEVARLLHPQGVAIGIGSGGVLDALMRREGMAGHLISVGEVAGEHDTGFYFVAKA